VTDYFTGKRILCIGAHPDDIELGCGATIAKYSGTSDIHCLILTKNDHLPRIGPELEETARTSLVGLGIAPDRIYVTDFQGREFQRHRQEIADALVGYRREIIPDLIISHSVNDIHQDHPVVHDEVIRIFRRNILSFETPRSSEQFKPNIYVPISEQYLEMKIDSLRPYHDLWGVDYLDDITQRSQLRMNGLKCDAMYAEAFEAFRLVFDGI